MPLTQTLLHTFKAKWEDVSLASWNKYPCEDRPDVLGIDVAHREIDNGVMKSTRVTFMKERLPYLMTKIFGAGYCICVEDSTVDPETKTMVLKSRNVSFRNIVSIEETCTYTTSPENPEWTQLEQKAKVTAFPYGVSGSIEKYLSDKFVTNAIKGQAIMENAILRVTSEAEGAYKSFLQETEDAYEKLKFETEQVLSSSSNYISNI